MRADRQTDRHAGTLIAILRTPPWGEVVTVTTTITSGQSNLTKRPHRRRTRTVQSYSPGGASVHPNLINASLDPHESTSQTASRSTQPFLHSSLQSFPILHNGPPFPSKLPLRMGIWTPYNSQFLGPIPVHNPTAY